MRVVVDSIKMSFATVEPLGGPPITIRNRSTEVSGVCYWGDGLETSLTTTLDDDEQIQLDELLLRINERIQKQFAHTALHLPA